MLPHSPALLSFCSVTGCYRYGQINDDDDDDDDDDDNINNNFSVFIM